MLSMSLTLCSRIFIVTIISGYLIRDAASGVTVGSTNGTDDGVAYDVTTPSREVECDTDNSWYSINDIKHFIVKVMREKKLFGSVNNITGLQELRLQQLSKNVTNYFDQLHVTPEHLLHVLHDVALRRQAIENVVNELNRKLNYPKLLDKAKYYGSGLEKVLEDLNTFEGLCKRNCRPSLARVIMSNYTTKVLTDVKEVNNKRYCSSIEQLETISETIVNELSNSSEIYIKSLYSKQFTKYEEQFEKAKTSIEEIALNKYSKLMYLVLKLEDMCHHLEEDMNAQWLHEYIRSVNGVITNISKNFGKLTTATKKYGKNCHHCSELAYRDPLSLHWKNNNRRRMFNDNSDLVVIVKKISETKFYTTIQNIFDQTSKETVSNLETKLSNINAEEIYVNNLKPLQHDIENIAGKEYDLLKSLNNLNDFSQLQDRLKTLDTELQHALKAVRNKLTTTVKYQPR